MTFSAPQLKDIRADFPILQTTMRGKPLIYLDNAATTQKPMACIEAITQYYTAQNANVHRGIYALSELATQKYEETRIALARFIHAPTAENIVFTRGATESINLVAHGFAETILQPDDEVIISAMEHHANIIPWQLACQKTGARLRIIALRDDTALDLDHLVELISSRTKLIALCYISNTLGNINPVAEVIALAKKFHIPVLLDAAQAIAHDTINVQRLGCDFLVFSAHKMYGPTGVGALYATSAWLEKLPVYQGGGDMIAEVTFESAIYQKPPHKFEAGTPNIAAVIAWASSIRYLEHLGLKNIQAYERELSHELHQRLQQLTEIQVVGAAKNKIGIASLVHQSAHPHDIATILDDEGIAIRAGQHCTMPLLTYLKLTATARVSLCFYNTVEEIDIFIRALKNLQRLFA